MPVLVATPPPKARRVIPLQGALARRASPRPIRDKRVFANFGESFY